MPILLRPTEVELGLSSGVWQQAWTELWARSSLLAYEYSGLWQDFKTICYRSTNIQVCLECNLPNAFWNLMYKSIRYTHIELAMELV